MATWIAEVHSVKSPCIHYLQSLGPSFPKGNNQDIMPHEYCAEDFRRPSKATKENVVLLPVGPTQCITGCNVKLMQEATTR